MTCIRVPGFEADDIIGTLATEAEADDYDTWMVTPDKDYQQLVTDRTVIWKPGRQGGGSRSVYTGAHSPTPRGDRTQPAAGGAR